jgi:hypothetical protein
MGFKCWYVLSGFSHSILRLEMSEFQPDPYPLVSWVVYPGIKRPKCENRIYCQLSERAETFFHVLHLVHIVTCRDDY